MLTTLDSAVWLKAEAPVLPVLLVKFSPLELAEKSLVMSLTSTAGPAVLPSVDTARLSATVVCSMPAPAWKSDMDMSWLVLCLASVASFTFS